MTGPQVITQQFQEPRTYSDVLSCPEASYWKEAVNSEIESIMKNYTWKLVDLYPGSKPLGH
jgi:hypothetical protein